MNKEKLGRKYQYQYTLIQLKRQENDEYVVYPDWGSKARFNAMMKHLKANIQHLRPHELR